MLDSPGAGVTGSYEQPKLETNLRNSAGAASILNCWAISPAPRGSQLPYANSKLLALKEADLAAVTKHVRKSVGRFILAHTEVST